MRIGKTVFMCFVAMILVLASSAPSEAMGKIANSDFILADLHAHPNSYIRYGGQSTGRTFYMSKPSLAVQKYEPPTYIITVQAYYHYTDVPGVEFIYDTELLRFKYDYDTRSMYVENKDRNGVKHWEYMDPKRIHDNEYYHRMGAKLVAGEMCFYLAYNMSFYDKPVSGNLRETLGME